MYRLIDYDDLSEDEMGRMDELENAVARPAQEVTEEKTMTTDIQKFALVDNNGLYYAETGLDTTADISRCMKFDTRVEAERIGGNLNSRFARQFDPIRIIGEPRGKHAKLWHAATCEYCGRADAAMADPTFDAAKVLPGGRALWICETCAKEKIESEMMRLGQVIN